MAKSFAYRYYKYPYLSKNFLHTNSIPNPMDCIAVPVSILRRRFSNHRLGYQSLSEDVFGESDNPITVVVGKERREFLLEPFVLEENPFRVLIDMLRKEDTRKVDYVGGSKHNKVIFMDVDAILFEHMLWLMQNDCSSLFQLNLRDIIDFYAQDV